MSSHTTVPTEDLTNIITRQPDQTFADNSQLTYLIPADTNLDLETTFKTLLEEGKPLTESIPQREALYFDETVDVLLILKTPWRGEKDLQSQLRRLIISLKARIVNTINQGRDPSPSADSETIFTGDVVDVVDPFIVVDEEQSDTVEDDASQQTVYAAWKLPVFLSRPRMRLQGPSIVFSASASHKPELAANTRNTHGTRYLQSGFPSGLNLLDSFGSDPALGGVRPRLSALRISSVAPVTRQQDLMKHIKALPYLKLRIFPVIHTRMRFSRPSTITPSTATIALLEIEFTRHFEYEAILDKIELTTTDGTVESLNDDAGMRLPLSCVAHDQVTFLYHIKPYESDVPRKKPTGQLGISISACVQVIPKVCTPQLSLSWNAALDFSIPVNPSFGQAPESGIQRSHRPAQLSISGPQAIIPLKSPASIRPDALPSLEASTNRSELAVPDLGITMSFNVPLEPIHPGDIFSWTIYVVNRSAEKAARPPRKLALVAVPKRRRNEVRPVRPPSSSGKRRGEKELADAVLDENVLHALQKSSAVDSVDVVCLSADTRVGPLAPGACHVAELQFLALREGVLGIEAIRVVDLGSQEHVDIKDLPTMIIEPAAA